MYSRLRGSEQIFCDNFQKGWAEKRQATAWPQSRYSVRVIAFNIHRIYMNNITIIYRIVCRDFHKQALPTRQRSSAAANGLLILDEILTMSRLLRGRRTKGIAL